MPGRALVEAIVGPEGSVAVLEVLRSGGGGRAGAAARLVHIQRALCPG